AGAHGDEVTPYAAYRLGGELDDPVTGADLEIDDASGFGGILSFPVHQNSWIELLFSRQGSTLGFDEFFGGTPLFDLTVDYYHVGGLFQWGGNGVNPFVLGSVGVTRLDPDDPARDSETNFSIGFGGGVKVLAGDHFGLRLEGRAYSTFIDGGEEIFCDPFGCFTFEDTDVLWQFEGKAGLVFRF
ncbi:MAG: outer membrane beta-barrel protein, partial [Acidobacteria bacterium]|nr:outer membrane beta-barrel protein [Acidobacteriota bacterium]